LEQEYGHQQGSGNKNYTNKQQSYYEQGNYTKQQQGHDYQSSGNQGYYDNSYNQGYGAKQQQGYDYQSSGNQNYYNKNNYDNYNKTGGGNSNQQYSNDNNYSKSKTDDGIEVIYQQVDNSYKGKGNDYKNNDYSRKDNKYNNQNQNQTPYQQNKGYDNQSQNTYQQNKGYDNQNQKPYQQNKGYDSQYQKPYQQNKGYDNQNQKPYQQNKGYDNQNQKPYQQNKSYDNQQNKGYSKQQYVPQNIQEVKYNEKGQKTYVIEKDVSDVKILAKDAELDYFGDDFEDYTTHNDEFADDNFEDDDYGDDLYEDKGDLDDGFGFDDTEITNQMGSMNINKPKNKLTFTNRENLTAMVDGLMKNEFKGYKDIRDSHVNVLMIAEKPSIAKSLSEALSSHPKMRKMGRGSSLFQFDGYFHNIKANFTVSSVMGHVYGADFMKQHNKWDSIDYLDLYDVPIEKNEANPKTKIPETLNRLARGKDIICLWLDCDKEGENICYEVLYNCYPYMNPKNYQQVYRAKFSSLTKQDLKAAFNKISEHPNSYESQSVDARQVIDLKIGVSFTRFLTSAILPGLKNTDLKLLSYGPCQTPTLWFCVNRQNEIDKFRSKEYFRVLIEIIHSKSKHNVYYRDHIHEKTKLNEFMKSVKGTETAKVVNVNTNTSVKQPPVGLNTVQMLRVASSYLKMSPHQTMVVAERLYTMGYVTYPRTETTKYASTFDFQKTINDYINHPTFGKNVAALSKGYRKPALRGVDVGDHPPITPARVATQNDLKGDYWALYEYITSTFFASIADAAEYETKVYQLDVNGHIFQCDSMAITKPGFLAFMPWKASGYTKDFPVLQRDSVINIVNITYESKWTEPPGHLSESDLIKLMEQNKIGTDASMPVHIENICSRNYVKVLAFLILG
jgi:DNA topoisomerase IA